MNRRQLKKQVLNLLQESSLEEMYQRLGHYPAHSLLNPLFIALCHPVEKVRWHAVWCFGRLVPAMAMKDLEAARIVMRRFLWMLNDESGGIGWGAPEALAEIMCHSEQLRKEYLHMLLSYMREDGEELHQDGNYLELPMLQRGLLWGIGRLCLEHRQEMLEQNIIDEVSAYLESSDLHVVGLAIWCLGILGIEAALEKIKRFAKCDAHLHLFLGNDINEISVAELVQRALDGKECNA